MKSRITAFVLMFVIIFAFVVPTEVFAASTSGSCGDGLSWSYSGGPLTISGSGSMTDYTAGGAPWKDYASAISVLKLSTGLKTIGDYAFYNFTALTSVSIPDSVTEIGAMAFRGCTKITTLVIPQNVKTLANSVFYGCSSLTEVIFSAVKCETMAYSKSYPVFAGCNALSSVIITEGVTELPAYSFEYAKGLKSITMPSTLRYIGDYAFSYCDALETVTLPANMSIIGNSAFQNDVNLSTVVVNDRLSKIGDAAFKKCTKLKSFTLSPLVASIGAYAFMDTGITEMEFESAVTYIGDKAFDGCTISKLKGPQYSYAHRYAEVYGYTFEITRYAGDGSGGSTGDDEVIKTQTELYTVNNTFVLYTKFNKPISGQAVHIALYSDTNKLVGYMIVPILKTIDHVNTIFDDDGTAVKAKVFVWNSILECEPLSSSEVIEIKRS